MHDERTNKILQYLRVCEDKEWNEQGQNAQFLGWAFNKITYILSIFHDEKMNKYCMNKSFCKNQKWMNDSKIWQNVQSNYAWNVYDICIF